MQLPGLEREAKILVSAQFSQLDPNVTDKDKDDDDEATADSAQADAGADAESAGETDNSEIGEDDKDDEASVANSETTSLAPTDKGELSNTSALCDGDCRPNHEWEYWKGRAMYVCLTCRSNNLCEECHEKRQSYNEDQTRCPVKGPYFCGRDHKYIKGPIEGWKGITNGVLQIDGEEDVDFKVWLEELRNDRWAKAWERFWLEE